MCIIIHFDRKLQVEERNYSDFEIHVMCKNPHHHYMFICVKYMVTQH